MGNLTDDITRLCDEIVALRDSRQIFSNQLDRETKEMKSEVATMRNGFRKANMDMAKRTKADRVKFVSNLDAEVAGMLKSFDKSHAEMAEKTKKANVEFVSNIANNISNMLTGYHKARADMAVKTKKENVAFVKDVVKFVTTKAKETAVMMDGFKADHAKMAKAAKAERKQFVSVLDTEVSAMRRVNVDDLAGARKAWNTLSPAGRKAKMLAEQKAKADAEMRVKLLAEARAKALAETKPAEPEKIAHAPVDSGAGAKKKDKK